jgi:hypothetical protein
MGDKRTPPILISEASPCAVLGESIMQTIFQNLKCDLAFGIFAVADFVGDAYYGVRKMLPV